MDLDANANVNVNSSANANTTGNGIENAISKAILFQVSSVSASDSRIPVHKLSKCSSVHLIRWNAYGRSQEYLLRQY